MRMVQDALHGMVLVYELEPSIKDSGPHALVFESRTWSSRLSDFPAGWQRMKSEELLALCKDRPTAIVS